MIFHANTNHDAAAVAMFISDKADFRTRTISRNKITDKERVESPRRPHDSKYTRTTNGPSSA